MGIIIWQIGRLSVLTVVVLCIVAQQSHTQIPTHSDNIQLLEQLIRSAREHFFRFNSSYWDSALHQSDRAYRLAQQLRLPAAIAEALTINIQIRSVISSQYNHLLEDAFQQLSLAESLNDKRLKMIASAQIGYCYANQNTSSVLQNQQAEKLLWDAIFYADTLHHKDQETSYMLCIAYNSLGLIQRSNKKNDEAIEFHQKALKRCTTVDNINRAWALHGIAVALEQKQHLNEALRYELQALELRERIGAGATIMISLYAIGRIYYKSGDYARALKFAQNAEQLHTKRGDKVIDLRIFKLLSDIYTAYRQPEKALHYHVRYTAYKDSAAKEESERNLNVLQANMELERSKLQNDLLRKDAENQDTKINAQRIIGIIVILFFLITLASLIYLFRLYRQKQSANKQLLEANHQISGKNNKLAELNEELSLFNTEKTELMSVVSHDLKNPINGIIGLTQVLLDNTALPNESRQKIYTQILHSAGRMAHLVRDILDLNRLESQASQPVITNVNLGVISAYMTDSYRNLADKKQLHLEYSYQATANVYVFADELFLHQIVDNLLSNAIKFSPPGKTIWVRVLQQPTTARFEVQDEGPGLSREDKSKLFHKFTRLTPQPTGGEHSTGLGLSIVKKMSEMIHGKVWCESESGKGACFILELPLAPEPEEQLH